MKTNRIVHFLAGLLLVFVSACGSQAISASGPTTERYATTLAVGGAHSCALLNNGHVLCWGDNSARQLGDGTSTMRTSAVEVPGLQDVVSVSAGGEFTCAALRDGSVQCWGANKSGQLGIGNNDLSTTPTVVPGLTNVVSVSAGTEHACALLDTGKVKCWGKNLNARVGDGSNTRLILSPVDVVGLDNVIGVFAGDEHTCALTKDGTAKCWGKNVDGELGNGQDTNLSKKPTDIVRVCMQNLKRGK